MKKIGIVICNYNKEDCVLDCIQSVLESRFQDFDLYVVDNASTDQSVAKIRKHYPQVTLLVNEENRGGSGGFNRGLRQVYEQGYPYLMCVDNDALLDENAIGSLYEFLESHPEAGMAGSKIYHTEAPDLIQQYGQKIDFEYFCTEVPHLNQIEDGTMPEYLYVDSVAACSLMVRRSTIDRIGFMPEENFLYWDDTEWCHKCNLAGMKVASVGTSKVLHAMGAKKESENTFPTYYAWRNWISFFAKYTPEEDYEKMAYAFLSNIFQVIYEGFHTGMQAKTKTVMLACDDALHGIVGKAGENRIFSLDYPDEPVRKLFEASQNYYIEANGHEWLAEELKQRAEKMGYTIGFMHHPNMVCAKSAMTSDQRLLELGEGIPYRTVFAESELLITDYSS
ncbi:MAG: glycosyltransferase family 2 protein, partial [Lachnospiraceae bacterium]|nr:glycosyltransferase family 2 protein [Lachnospiraceae bacterium]